MAFDTTKRRSWLLPARALSRDSMPSGIPDRRCVAVQGQLETLRCGCFSQQVQEQPHHAPPRGAEPTMAPSLLFPALPLPRFFFFLPHFLPAVQLVAEQKRLDLEEGIHKDLARERRWRHLLESS